MRSRDSGIVNLKGWPAAWCGVLGRPARGTGEQGCGRMVKAVSQRTKKWVEHKQNIKLEVAENSAELEFALHFGEGKRGPYSDPRLLETRFLFQLPGRVARGKCAWVTELEGKRLPAARKGQARLSSSPPPPPRER